MYIHFKEDTPSNTDEIRSFIFVQVKFSVQLYYYTCLNAIKNSHSQ